MQTKRELEGLLADLSFIYGTIQLVRDQEAQREVHLETLFSQGMAKINFIRSALEREVTALRRFDGKTPVQIAQELSEQERFTIQQLKEGSGATRIAGEILEDFYRLGWVEQTWSGIELTQEGMAILTAILAK